jgi:ribonuclease-3
VTTTVRDLRPLVDDLDLEAPDALVERALTHSSFAYEAGGSPDYERLEFLGDAVLTLFVADELFRAGPDLSEKELSRFRAGLVSRATLAELARAWQLEDWVRVGKGEPQGADVADSILSDVVEALIGAAFESGGKPAADRVCRRLLGELIPAAVRDGLFVDWKTELGLLCAASGLARPTYTSEKHDAAGVPVFAAVVEVDGEKVGEGRGRTRKRSEMVAAEQAVAVLRERADSDAAE